MGRTDFSSRLASEASRQYLSTGRISNDLRPAIRRAWIRSHESGASCRRMRAEVLPQPDVDRLLSDRAEFIQAARPYLQMLSQAAGGARHAAMLGDELGFVLDVVGDERSVHGPESVPGPGSLLEEALSGANGIGTPVAEGGYVDIVGAEHFIVGFHPFTCQGIPIAGVDGAPAGVISTSVRTAAASARLKHILFCAAHGIQAELVAKRLQEDVDAYLDDPADAAVRHLRQDVIQAHNAGRIGLRLASELAAKEGAEQSVLTILGQANRCLQQFVDRATTWRQLAGAEQGMAVRLDVRDVVERILDLLGTEASVRSVTLLPLEPDAALPATADERTLARSVLISVQAALEAAGPGGVVQVEVGTRAAKGQPGVAISAVPAPGGRLEPRRWSIHVPGCAR